MFERFAQDARTAVVHAVEEAQGRGDRRIGTDHLLLGLLHDPSIAEMLGASLEAARDSSDTLDSTALRAIGVDLRGGQAGWAPTGRTKHTPFNSGAKDLMRDALGRAVSEHSRSLEARHLLGAVLDLHAPDPAAVLLAELKIDLPAVRSALAHPDAA